MIFSDTILIKAGIGPDKVIYAHEFLICSIPSIVFGALYDILKAVLHAVNIFDL